MIIKYKLNVNSFDTNIFYSWFSFPIHFEFCSWLVNADEWWKLYISLYYEYRMDNLIWTNATTSHIKNMMYWNTEIQTEWTGIENTFNFYKCSYALCTLRYTGKKTNERKNKNIENISSGNFNWDLPFCSYR